MGSVERRSGAELAPLFFPFDPHLMDGEWERCSTDWVANGGISSSEILTDADNKIIKVKRGAVSFCKVVE
jgi:hypothetical protein